MKIAVSTARFESKKEIFRSSSQLFPIHTVNVKHTRLWSFMQKVFRSQRHRIFSTIKDIRGLELITLLQSHKMSSEQFEFDGCDNCEKHLKLKDNKNKVENCTSANFDGMIALMGGEDSWVAKWQRISRSAKGVYAISVGGRLPPGVVNDLKEQGITYRSRDNSVL